MTIKAILIDDEPDSLSVLSKLLTQFCPEVEICGTAGDCEQAYQLALSSKPDVVFLDIQMPGGNGFSLIRKFTAVPFEVIFVTSYDKYAIEAIRFSALDYLLKPVEVLELTAAIARLQAVLHSRQNRNLQFRNMLDNYEGGESRKKITVHHKDEVRFLALNEITHLEAERNYTFIYTASGKYTSSKNLGEFEEMFEDYQEFMRISKSCIVNLDHVSKYLKGEPCMLTVGEKYSFEISRRKKKELLDRLKGK
jgi:two-component system, LytTR family, response regulator